MFKSIVQADFSKRLNFVVNDKVLLDLLKFFRIITDGLNSYYSSDMDKIILKIIGTFKNVCTIV